MRRLKILPLLCLCAALGGCLSSTPFQSARIVKPGETRSTVSFQRSDEALAGDGEDDGAWSLLEMTNRWGGGNGRGDVAFTSALVLYDEGFLGGMLGMSGKVALAPDRLALELPIRLALMGEGFEHTTHLYPRLIGTIDLNPSVELNLSLTRFFYLTWEAEELWGYGIGLGIRNDDGRMFRPEIGILDGPGGDVIQIGLGFDLDLRKRRPGERGGEVTPR